MDLLRSFRVPRVYLLCTGRGNGAGQYADIAGREHRADGAAGVSRQERISNRFSLYSRLASLIQSRTERGADNAGAARQRGRRQLFAIQEPSPDWIEDRLE